MDIDADITEHYSQGAERDRLATWGRLEAARTTDLLARFLPAAPAIVVDLGGADHGGDDSPADGNL